MARYPAADAHAQPTGPTRMGWTLSVLVLLFLLMDLSIKFAMLQPVIDTTAALGWPTDRGTIYTLAVLLTVSAALYAWPRTALLGAILLTGYLGGAIATHLRIGSPLLTHTLFGGYVGVILWTGLWLRDPALRAMLPLRRS